MEGNGALRVVAALLAFGGAAVLGSAVARRLAKRYRSAAYSIGGEKNRAGWVSWLVRNGVGSCALLPGQSFAMRGFVRRLQTCSQPWKGLDS